MNRFCVDIMRIALTSNKCECEEHDGVKEAETHGQGVLVHHCRDRKHTHRGCTTELSLGQLGDKKGIQRPKYCRA